MLQPVALPLELDLSHKPHVILVVGVNGTGKTTTIGKLAAKLTAGGLSVMLAAGDTFRAAAIEQLKIWGERTGSPVVSSKIGADAAGLAYDAFEKAKAAGSDVLIIDTAGRLQNRTELMAELEKIVRVLGKHDPEAPHTVLQTRRRDDRPERAQPGRDLPQRRRRQRPGHDQARRHGARRHPCRHRRQAQAAGLFHRRRRTGRRPRTVLGAAISPRRSRERRHDMQTTMPEADHRTRSSNAIPPTRGRRRSTRSSSSRSSSGR